MFRNATHLPKRNSSSTPSIRQTTNPKNHAANPEITSNNETTTNKTEPVGTSHTPKNPHVKMFSKIWLTHSSPPPSPPPKSSKWWKSSWNTSINLSKSQKNGALNSLILTWPWWVKKKFRDKQRRLCQSKLSKKKIQTGIVAATSRLVFIA